MTRNSPQIYQSVALLNLSPIVHVLQRIVSVWTAGEECLLEKEHMRHEK